MPVEAKVIRFRRPEIIGETRFELYGTESTEINPTKGLPAWILIRPNQDRLADIRTHYPGGEIVQTILCVGKTGRASTLQDVEAKRKTEIDVIQGAIVREGISSNVPTPLDALVTTLAHGREASWAHI